MIIDRITILNMDGLTLIECVNW